MKIGKGGVEARHGIERKILGAVFVITITCVWFLLFVPAFSSLIVISGIRRNASNILIEKIHLKNGLLLFSFKFKDLNCPFTFQNSSIEIGLGVSRNEEPFAYITSQNISTTQTEEGFQVDLQFKMNTSEESNQNIPEEMRMGVKNHILLLVKGHIRFGLRGRYLTASLPIYLMNTPSIYIGNTEPRPEKLIEPLKEVRVIRDLKSESEKRNALKRTMPIRVTQYEIKDTTTSTKIQGKYIYTFPCKFLITDVPEISMNIYINDRVAIHAWISMHKIHHGESPPVDFSFELKGENVNGVKKSVIEYLEKKETSITFREVEVNKFSESEEQKVISSSIKKILNVYTLYFVKRRTREMRVRKDPLTEIQILNVYPFGVYGRYILDEELLPIKGLFSSINAGKLPSVSVQIILNGKPIAILRSTHYTKHKEKDMADTHIILEGVATFHSTVRDAQAILLNNMKKGDHLFRKLCAIVINEEGSSCTRSLLEGFGLRWKKSRGVQIGYNWVKENERVKRKKDKFLLHHAFYSFMFDFKKIPSSDTPKPSKLLKKTSLAYFDKYEEDKYALGKLIVDLGKRIEKDNYIRVRWNHTTFVLSVNRVPVFLTIKKGGIEALIGPRNSPWSTRGIAPLEIVIGVGYKNIFASTIKPSIVSIFSQEYDQRYIIPQAIGICFNEKLTKKLGDPKSKDRSNTVHTMVEKIINAFLTDAFFDLSSNEKNNKIVAKFRIDTSEERNKEAKRTKEGEALESGFAFHIHVPPIDTVLTGQSIDSYKQLLGEEKNLGHLKVSGSVISIYAIVNKPHAFIMRAQENTEKEENIAISGCIEETIFRNTNYNFIGKPKSFLPHKNIFKNIYAMAKYFLETETKKPVLFSSNADTNINDSANSSDGIKNACIYNDITTAVNVKKISDKLTINIDFSLDKMEKPKEERSVLVIPNVSYSAEDGRNLLFQIETKKIEIDVTNDASTMLLSMQIVFTDYFSDILINKKTDTLVEHSISIKGTKKENKKVYFKHLTIRQIERLFAFLLTPNPKKQKEVSVINELIEDIEISIDKVEGRVVENGIETTPPLSAKYQTASYIKEIVTNKNTICIPQKKRESPGKFSSLSKEELIRIVSQEDIRKAPTPFSIKPKEKLMTNELIFSSKEDINFAQVLCTISIGEKTIEQIRKLIIKNLSKVIETKRRKIEIAFLVEDFSLIKGTYSPSAAKVQTEFPHLLFHLSMANATCVFRNSWHLGKNTPVKNTCSFSVSLITPYIIDVSKEMISTTELQLNPIYNIYAKYLPKQEKPSTKRKNYLDYLKENKCLIREIDAPFSNEQESGFLGYFKKAKAIMSNASKKLFGVGLQQVPTIKAGLDSVSNLCLYKIEPTEQILKKLKDEPEYLKTIHSPKNQDLYVFYVDLIENISITSKSTPLLIVEYKKKNILIIPLHASKTKNTKYMLYGIYSQLHLLRSPIDSTICIYIVIENTKILYIEIPKEISTSGGDILLERTNSYFMSLIGKASFALISPFNWICYFLSIILHRIRVPDEKDTPYNIRKLLLDSISVISRAEALSNIQRPN
ncbi:hypothetical protein NEFER01_1091 [Nematocida sp. LUAm1]|nr:hypothetical protein NEFER02_0810 [Nematocida sp. LUAm2]KAI5177889.1 hypothetical protein NEFER01_1091 [Nematocida sp. LUAm1]